MYIWLDEDNKVRHIERRPNIEELYTAEMIAQFIEIPDNDELHEGDSYDPQTNVMVNYIEDTSSYDSYFED